MGKGMLPLLELLLIVGVVFGFGFWQLAALKRDEQQKREECQTGELLGTAA